MAKSLSKHGKRSSGAQGRSNFRSRHSPGSPSGAIEKPSRQVAPETAAPPNLPAAATASFLASPAQELAAFLEQDVGTALRQRGILPEQTQAPRKDLLLRTVDALRCSADAFRPHYARLIASSMDVSESIHVHPAWIEMLKQLTEDEIAFLVAFPPPGRVAISADLVIMLRSQEMMVAYRHIIPEKLAATCRHKSNIPMYVDNLIRLNLIHKPAAQQADHAAYQPLMALGFVEQLRDAAPRTARVNFDQSVLGITNLGEHFRRSCLLD